MRVFLRCEEFVFTQGAFPKTGSGVLHVHPSETTANRAPEFSSRTIIVEWLGKKVLPDRLLADVRPDAARHWFVAIDFSVWSGQPDASRSARPGHL